MKRFLWKIYLLWHGYCSKHGIEKSLEIGYDEWGGGSYCEECEKERDAIIKARIAKARSVIVREARA